MSLKDMYTPCREAERSKHPQTHTRTDAHTQHEDFLHYSFGGNSLEFVLHQFVDSHLEKQIFQHFEISLQGTGMLLGGLKKNLHIFSKVSDRLKVSSYQVTYAEEFSRSGELSVANTQYHVCRGVEVGLETFIGHQCI